MSRKFNKYIRQNMDSCNILYFGSDDELHRHLSAWSRFSENVAQSYLQLSSALHQECSDLEKSCKFNKGDNINRAVCEVSELLVENVQSASSHLQAHWNGFNNATSPWNELCSLENKVEQEIRKKQYALLAARQKDEELLKKAEKEYLHSVEKWDDVVIKKDSIWSMSRYNKQLAKCKATMEQNYAHYRSVHGQDLIDRQKFVESLKILEREWCERQSELLGLWKRASNLFISKLEETSSEATRSRFRDFSQGFKQIDIPRLVNYALEAKCEKYKFPKLKDDFENLMASDLETDSGTDGETATKKRKLNSLRSLVYKVDDEVDNNNHDTLQRLSRITTPKKEITEPITRKSSESPRKTERNRLNIPKIKTEEPSSGSDTDNKKSEKKLNKESSRSKKIEKISRSRRGKRSRKYVQSSSSSTSCTSSSEDTEDLFRRIIKEEVNKEKKNLSRKRSRPKLSVKSEDHPNIKKILKSVGACDDEDKDMEIKITLAFEGLPQQQVQSTANPQSNSRVICCCGCEAYFTQIQGPTGELFWRMQHSLQAPQPSGSFGPLFCNNSYTQHDNFRPCCHHTSNKDKRKREHREKIESSDSSDHEEFQKGVVKQETTPLESTFLKSPKQEAGNQKQQLIKSENKKPACMKFSKEEVVKPVNLIQVIKKEESMDNMQIEQLPEKLKEPSMKVTVDRPVAVPDQLSPEDAIESLSEIFKNLSLNPEVNEGEDKKQHPSRTKKLTRTARVHTNISSSDEEVQKKTYIKPTKSQKRKESVNNSKEKTPENEPLSIISDVNNQVDNLTSPDALILIGETDVQFDATPELSNNEKSDTILHGSMRKIAAKIEKNVSQKIEPESESEEEAVEYTPFSHETKKDESDILVYEALNEETQSQHLSSSNISKKANLNKSQISKVIGSCGSSDKIAYSDTIPKDKEYTKVLKAKQLTVNNQVSKPAIPLQISSKMSSFSKTTKKEENIVIESFESDDGSIQFDSTPQISEQEKQEVQTCESSREICEDNESWNSFEEFDSSAAPENIKQGKPEVQTTSRESYEDDKSAYFKLSENTGNKSPVNSGSWGLFEEFDSIATSENIEQGKLEVQTSNSGSYDSVNKEVSENTGYKPSIVCEKNPESFKVVNSGSWDSFEEFDSIATPENTKQGKPEVQTSHRDICKEDQLVNLKLLQNTEIKSPVNSGSWDSVKEEVSKKPEVHTSSREICKEICEGDEIVNFKLSKNTENKSPVNSGSWDSVKDVSKKSEVPTSSREICEEICEGDEIVNFELSENTGNKSPVNSGSWDSVEEEVSKKSEVPTSSREICEEICEGNEIVNFKLSENTGNNSPMNSGSWDSVEEEVSKKSEVQKSSREICEGDELSNFELSENRGNKSPVNSGSWDSVEEEVSKKSEVQTSSREICEGNEFANFKLSGNKSPVNSGSWDSVEEEVSKKSEVQTAFREICEGDEFANFKLSGNKSPVNSGSWDSVEEEVSKKSVVQTSSREICEGNEFANFKLSGNKSPMNSGSWDSVEEDVSKNTGYKPSILCETEKGPESFKVENLESWDSVPEELDAVDNLSDKFKVKLADSMPEDIIKTTIDAEGPPVEDIGFSQSSEFVNFETTPEVSKTEDKVLSPRKTTTANLHTTLSSSDEQIQEKTYLKPTKSQERISVNNSNEETPKNEPLSDGLNNQGASISDALTTPEIPAPTDPKNCLVLDHTDKVANYSQDVKKEEVKSEDISCHEDKSISGEYSPPERYSPSSELTCYFETTPEGSGQEEPILTPEEMTSDKTPVAELQKKFLETNVHSLPNININMQTTNMIAESVVKNDSPDSEIGEAGAHFGTTPEPSNNEKSDTVLHRSTQKINSNDEITKVEEEAKFINKSEISNVQICDSGDEIAYSSTIPKPSVEEKTEAKQPTASNQIFEQAIPLQIDSKITKYNETSNEKDVSINKSYDSFFDSTPEISEQDKPVQTHEYSGEICDDYESKNTGNKSTIVYEKDSESFKDVNSGSLGEDGSQLELKEGTELIEDRPVSVAGLSSLHSDNFDERSDKESYDNKIRAKSLTDQLSQEEAVLGYTDKDANYSKNVKKEEIKSQQIISKEEKSYHEDKFISGEYSPPEHYSSSSESTPYGGQEKAILTPEEITCDDIGKDKNPVSYEPQELISGANIQNLTNMETTKLIAGSVVKDEGLDSAVGEADVYVDTTPKLSNKKKSDTITYGSTQKIDGNDVVTVDGPVLVTDVSSTHSINFDERSNVESYDKIIIAKSSTDQLSSEELDAIDILSEEFIVKLADFITEEIIETAVNVAGPPVEEIALSNTSIGGIFKAYQQEIEESDEQEQLGLEELDAIEILSEEFVAQLADFITEEIIETAVDEAGPPVEDIALSNTSVGGIFKAYQQELEKSDEREQLGLEELDAIEILSEEFVAQLADFITEEIIETAVDEAGPPVEDIALSNTSVGGIFKAYQQELEESDEREQLGLEESGAIEILSEEFVAQLADFITEEIIETAIDVAGPPVENIALSNTSVREIFKAYQQELEESDEREQIAEFFTDELFEMNVGDLDISPVGNPSRNNLDGLALKYEAEIIEEDHNSTMANTEGVAMVQTEVLSPRKLKIYEGLYRPDGSSPEISEYLPSDKVTVNEDPQRELIKNETFITQCVSEQSDNSQSSELTCHFDTTPEVSEGEDKVLSPRKTKKRTKTAKAHATLSSSDEQLQGKTNKPTKSLKRNKSKEETPKNEPLSQVISNGQGIQGDNLSISDPLTPPEIFVPTVEKNCQTKTVLDHTDKDANYFKNKEIKPEQIVSEEDISYHENKSISKEYSPPEHYSPSSDPTCHFETTPEGSDQGEAILMPEKMACNDTKKNKTPVPYESQKVIPLVAERLANTDVVKNDDSLKSEVDEADVYFGNSPELSNNEKADTILHGSTQKTVSEIKRNVPKSVEIEFDNQQNINKETNNESTEGYDISLKATNNITGESFVQYETTSEIYKGESLVNKSHKNEVIPQITLKKIDGNNVITKEETKVINKSQIPMCESSDGNADTKPKLSDEENIEVLEAKQLAVGNQTSKPAITLQIESKTNKKEEVILSDNYESDDGSVHFDSTPEVSEQEKTGLQIHEPSAGLCDDDDELVNFELAKNTGYEPSASKKDPKSFEVVNLRSTLECQLESISSFSDQVKEHEISHESSRKDNYTPDFEPSDHETTPSKSDQLQHESSGAKSSYENFDSLKHVIDRAESDSETEENSGSSSCKSDKVIDYQQSEYETEESIEIEYFKGAKVQKVKEIKSILKFPISDTNLQENSVDEKRSVTFYPKLKVCEIENRINGVINGLYDDENDSDLSPADEDESDGFTEEVFENTRKNSYSDYLDIHPPQNETCATSNQTAEMPSNGHEPSFPPRNSYANFVAAQINKETVGMAVQNDRPDGKNVEHMSDLDESIAESIHEIISAEDVVADENISIDNDENKWVEEQIVEASNDVFLTEVHFENSSDSFLEDEPVHMVIASAVNDKPMELQNVTVISPRNAHYIQATNEENKLLHHPEVGNIVIHGGKIYKADHVYLNDDNVTDKYATYDSESDIVTEDLSHPRKPKVILEENEQASGIPRVQSKTFMSFPPPQPKGKNNRKDGYVGNAESAENVCSSDEDNPHPDSARDVEEFQRLEDDFERYISDDTSSPIAKLGIPRVQSKTFMSFPPPQLHGRNNAVYMNGEDDEYVRYAESPENVYSFDEDNPHPAPACDVEEFQRLEDDFEKNISDDTSGPKAKLGIPRVHSRTFMSLCPAPQTHGRNNAVYMNGEDDEYVRYAESPENVYTPDEDNPQLVPDVEEFQRLEDDFERNISDNMSSPIGRLGIPRVHSQTFMSLPPPQPKGDFGEEQKSTDEDTKSSPIEKVGVSPKTFMPRPPSQPNERNDVLNRTNEAQAKFDESVENLESADYDEISDEDKSHPASVYGVDEFQRLEGAFSRNISDDMSNSIERLGIPRVHSQTFMSLPPPQPKGRNDVPHLEEAQDEKQGFTDEDIEISHIEKLEISRVQSRTIMPLPPPQQKGKNKVVYRNEKNNESVGNSESAENVFSGEDKPHPAPVCDVKLEYKFEKKINEDTISSPLKKLRMSRVRSKTFMSLPPPQPKGDNNWEEAHNEELKSTDKDTRSGPIDNLGIPRLKSKTFMPCPPTQPIERNNVSYRNKAHGKDYESVENAESPANVHRYECLDNSHPVPASDDDFERSIGDNTMSSPMKELGIPRAQSNTFTPYPTSKGTQKDLHVDETQAEEPTDEDNLQPASKFDVEEFKRLDVRNTDQSLKPGNLGIPKVQSKTFMPHPPQKGRQNVLHMEETLAKEEETVGKAESSETVYSYETSDEDNPQPAPKFDVEEFKRLDVRNTDQSLKPGNLGIPKVQSKTFMPHPPQKGRQNVLHMEETVAKEEDTVGKAESSETVYSYETSDEDNLQQASKFDVEEFKRLDVRNTDQSLKLGNLGIPKVQSKTFMPHPPQKGRQNVLHMEETVAKEEDTVGKAESSETVYSYETSDEDNLQQAFKFDVEEFKRLDVRNTDQSLKPGNLGIPKVQSKTFMPHPPQKGRQNVLHMEETVAKENNTAGKAESSETVYSYETTDEDNPQSAPAFDVEEFKRLDVRITDRSPKLEDDFKRISSDDTDSNPVAFEKPETNACMPCLPMQPKKDNTNEMKLQSNTKGAEKGAHSYESEMKEEKEHKLIYDHSQFEREMSEYKQRTIFDDDFQENSYMTDSSDSSNIIAQPQKSLVYEDSDMGTDLSYESEQQQKPTEDEEVLLEKENEVIEIDPNDVQGSWKKILSVQKKDVLYPELKKDESIIAKAEQHITPAVMSKQLSSDLRLTPVFDKKLDSNKQWLNDYEKQTAMEFAEIIEAQTQDINYPELAATANSPRTVQELAKGSIYEKRASSLTSGDSKPERHIQAIEDWHEFIETQKQQIVYPELTPKQESPRTFQELARKSPFAKRAQNMNPGESMPELHVKAAEDWKEIIEVQKNEILYPELKLESPRPLDTIPLAKSENNIEFKPKDCTPARQRQEKEDWKEILNQQKYDFINKSLSPSKTSNKEEESPRDALHASRVDWIMDNIDSISPSPLGKPRQSTSVPGMKKGNQLEPLKPASKEKKKTKKANRKKEKTAEPTHFGAELEGFDGTKFNSSQVTNDNVLDHIAAMSRGFYGDDDNQSVIRYETPVMPTYPNYPQYDDASQDVSLPPTPRTISGTPRTEYSRNFSPLQDFAREQMLYNRDSSPSQYANSENDSPRGSRYMTDQMPISPKILGKGPLDQFSKENTYSALHEAMRSMDSPTNKLNLSPRQPLLGRRQAQQNEQSARMTQQIKQDNHVIEEVVQDPFSCHGPAQTGENTDMPDVFKNPHKKNTKSKLPFENSTPGFRGILDDYLIQKKEEDNMVMRSSYFENIPELPSALPVNQNTVVEKTGPLPLHVQEIIEVEEKGQIRPPPFHPNSRSLHQEQSMLGRRPTLINGKPELKVRDMPGMCRQLPLRAKEENKTVPAEKIPKEEPVIRNRVINPNPNMTIISQEELMNLPRHLVEIVDLVYSGQVPREEVQPELAAKLPEGIFDCAPYPPEIYRPGMFLAGLHPEMFLQGQIHPDMLPPGVHPDMLPPGSVLSREVQPEMLPRNVYSDMLPHDVHQDFLHPGIHPDMRQRDVHPDMLPRDVHPNMLPRDVHSNMLQRNVHPDMLPHNVHPDMLPHGVHPDMLQHGVHPEMLQHGVHPEMLQHGVHPKMLQHGVHPEMLQHGVHQEMLPQDFHSEMMASGIYAEDSDADIHPELYIPPGSRPCDIDLDQVDPYFLPVADLKKLNAEEKKYLRECLFEEFSKQSVTCNSNLLQPRCTEDEELAAAKERAQKWDALRDLHKKHSAYETPRSKAPKKKKKPKKNTEAIQKPSTSQLASDPDPQLLPSRYLQRTYEQSGHTSYEGSEVYSIPISDTDQGLVDHDHQRPQFSYRLQSDHLLNQPTTNIRDTKNTNIPISDNKSKSVSPRPNEQSTQGFIRAASAMPSTPQTSMDYKRPPSPSINRFLKRSMGEPKSPDHAFEAADNSLSFNSELSQPPKPNFLQSARTEMAGGHLTHSREIEENNDNKQTFSSTHEHRFLQRPIETPLTVSEQNPVEQLVKSSGNFAEIIPKHEPQKERFQMKPKNRLDNLLSRASAVVKEKEVFYPKKAAEEKSPRSQENAIKESVDKRKTTISSPETAEQTSKAAFSRFLKKDTDTVEKKCPIPPGRFIKDSSQVLEETALWKKTRPTALSPPPITKSDDEDQFSTENISSIKDDYQKPVIMSKKSQDESLAKKTGKLNLKGALESQSKISAISSSSSISNPFDEDEPGYIPFFRKDKKSYEDNLLKNEEKQKLSTFPSKFKTTQNESRDVLISSQTEDKNKKSSILANDDQSEEDLNPFAEKKQSSLKVRDKLFDENSSKLKSFKDEDKKGKEDSSSISNPFDEVDKPQKFLAKYLEDKFAANKIAHKSIISSKKEKDSSSISNPFDEDEKPKYSYKAQNKSKVNTALGKGKPNEEFTFFAKPKKAEPQIIKEAQEYSSSISNPFDEEEKPKYSYKTQNKSKVSPTMIREKPNEEFTFYAKPKQVEPQEKLTNTEEKKSEFHFHATPKTSGKEKRVAAASNEEAAEVKKSEFQFHATPRKSGKETTPAVDEVKKSEFQFHATPRKSGKEQRVAAVSNESSDEVKEFQFHATPKKSGNKIKAATSADEVKEFQFHATPRKSGREKTAGTSHGATDEVKEFQFHATPKYSSKTEKAATSHEAADEVKEFQFHATPKKSSKAKKATTSHGAADEVEEFQFHATPKKSGKEKKATTSHGTADEGKKERKKSDKKQKEKERKKQKKRTPSPPPSPSSGKPTYFVDSEDARTSDDIPSIVDEVWD